MKHISILVLDDITLTSLDTTRQLFLKVNDFLEAKGQDLLFEIELVGRAKETRIHGGLYIIRADKLLSEVEETDLIIVPQLCGSFPELVKQNAVFVPWIIEKYNKGAEIASLCAGAFLLASTGLIKGRSCVVHWASAHEFSIGSPRSLTPLESSKANGHVTAITVMTISSAAAGRGTRTASVYPSPSRLRASGAWGVWDGV